MFATCSISIALAVPAASTLALEREGALHITCLVFAKVDLIRVSFVI